MTAPVMLDRLVGETSAQVSHRGGVEYLGLKVGYKTRRALATMKHFECRLSLIGGTKSNQIKSTVDLVRLLQLERRRITLSS